MAGDMSRCVQIAVEASTIESQAMQLDREGNAVRACEEYRKAAARLGEAAAAVPNEHPDGPVISRHADEVLARVAYLEGLNGAPATTPLEEHIKGVQLSMGSPPPGGTAGPAGCASPAGGSKVMAAAAGAGGIAGFMVMGPMAAVALAGAAAYATTREDKIGSAARTVGTGGVTALQKAKSFDDNYQVTQRVAAAGSNAVGKAKEMDEKYQVIDKAKTGVSQAGSAVSDFNERHQVTAKVGAGLTRAASGIGGVLNRARSSSNNTS